MKGKQSVKNSFNKAKLNLLRSSPTILSCLAGIGVVVTVTFGIRGTPKAMRLLEEAKKEKGENLTKTETVLVAGPVYIPTALIGLSTILCIFGANILNKRQQALLTSAYTILNQSYKEYKNAAKYVYGEDADYKIEAEIAKNTYLSCDGYCTYIPESEEENILFFDFYSKRYFTSTYAAVLDAIYHLNRNFVLRGYTTVNELYDFLGIDKVDGGDQIGWEYEFMMVDYGCAWIDFDNSLTKMEDGLECVILAMVQQPELFESI